MRSLSITLVCLALASTASATTFLVPTDRRLIASSDAIVIGTAGEGRGQRGEGGSIETVTTVRIEESIRGPVHAGESIDVVELGGRVADNGLVIAGGARFRSGERVLLFLRRDDAEHWRVNAMTLGKFSFIRGGDGQELLLRDAREICGWNERGEWHREPYREATRFLRFVRTEARGGVIAVADYVVPPTASLRALEPQADASGQSYMFENFFPRWNTFPGAVVFQSNGSQPGAPSGGIPALQRGLAVWTNDAESNVVLQYGGTTSRTTAFTQDGVHAVIFNDLGAEVPGVYPQDGVLAIGGVFTSGSHVYGGESFATVIEAGLVVQNGLTGRGLTTLGFEHVIAHEIGHTLGFRHSDEPHSGGTSSINALMNSTIDFDFDTTGATLQAWDLEAVRAVYGSGGPPPPPCVPPSIVTQPQSIALGSGSVSLSVQATGTTPFAYQWFEGSRGDTRFPIAGGNNPVISVGPVQTTSYWVRVTGQCAPAADSQSATVTVAGCPAIAITSRSADVSILEGTTQTLSVGVSSSGRPVTFRWYAGERGDTSRLVGTEPTLTVTPAVSTPYWVEVRNDCGAVATSETINITVRPCTAPRIILQPANAEAIFGRTATLAATISGTPPMQMQWYEGSRLDTSRPVSGATSASIETPALNNTTTFWLHASNECGSIDTEAVTVTVVAECTRPVITSQPRSHFVPAGTATILTVGATGPSLTYRWYQGAVGNFTKPLSGSAPSVATAAIVQPTQFWVVVDNPCGSANSVAATVTPSNARRRAAGR